jgi:predicted permease
MNVRRLFIGLALLAYPRDFREAYRAQIFNDIEEENASTLTAAVQLLWGGVMMRGERFMRDASYALRRLRKMPLFATLVALTFALGIGANVAVFSILNAVLLRPLPYPNVSRLVVFRAHNARQPGVGHSLSIPELDDFTTQSKALEHLAAAAPDGATLTGAGKPKAVSGYDVTLQYFDALGVQPQLGRFFTARDQRKGVYNIILSDSLWRGSFGANPRILGQIVRLDGIAYTVVGVAPHGFRAPDFQRGSLVPADYWTVQPDTAPPSQRGAVYLGVVGLLRPGVSLDAANAELRLISDRLQRRYPGYESGSTYFVEPLAQAVLGGISSALWTVFVAVLGILIVACANVASMLIANASTRDREFAVRAALGASRRRLSEQLLIETGALAAFGGVIGVALAYGVLAVLRPALSSFPHIETLRIDTAALSYALGTVLLCTALAGLWPVAALRYASLNSTLKTAGRSGSNAAGNRLRSGLIVTEVAIALALVVLSGLMVRSFYTLVHADLGIQPRGVLVTRVIGLPSRRYGNLNARAAFEQRFLDRLKAIPGVESAALSVSYPLSNVMVQFQVGIVGRKFAPNEEPALAENTITPEYFHTLGIPVLRGRAFDDRDTSASAPVAIVNEAFARLYGKNGDALGMRIRTPGWNGTAVATRTIVGVAADIRANLQSPARPEYYVPLRQAPPDLLSALVRSASVPPQQLAVPVQRAIAQVDPTMAPPETTTFTELIAEQSEQARSTATLLAALGIAALLLALSGIFGIVSYSVTQRYGEFGVRVALGARSATVMLDVLVRALSITAFGVVIGLTLAAFAAQAVREQLYRVSPLDPLTFISVVALIAVCAAAAALLPALRAMRIDPAVALRYE